MSFASTVGPANSNIKGSSKNWEISTDQLVGILATLFVGSGDPVIRANRDVPDRGLDSYISARAINSRLVVYVKLLH
jgi:hypothetical protein